jgi:hypothetical protein
MMDRQIDNPNPMLADLVGDEGLEHALLDARRNAAASVAHRDVSEPLVITRGGNGETAITRLGHAFTHDTSCLRGQSARKGARVDRSRPCVRLTFTEVIG